MRSRAADAAAQRLRPAFVAASLLLILLLAVFAIALAHSQNQQKRDLERRFEDRARVAATVNESLFSLATGSAKQSDVQHFGAATVSKQFLQQRTATQQQAFAAILDGNGKILAQTGSTQNLAAARALAQRATKANQVIYSSLMPGPHGTTTIQSALAFPTKYGTRVDVSESKADVLSQFLNSFLSRLPNVANAKSYVVDNKYKVVATPGSKTQAGASLNDPKLAKALTKGSEGSYDGSRFFASAPIAATPWRIVITAAKSDLYSSVKTTVSWIIFAAFVLVSLLGMTLLWRVLISNAELQRADLSRRHALEINDNVVQRLVLAKYALDRGATETSQQKLAETLRETQQLVTSMLEEREIAPGSLRREVAAETEKPPDPATRSVEGRP